MMEGPDFERYSPERLKSLTPEEKVAVLKELHTKGSAWVKARQREISLMEAGLTTMPWEKDYVELQKKDIELKQSWLDISAMITRENERRL